VSEKSYTIVFEDHPDYLFALVHGDQYGYEVLSGFLKDIADECKRRNFRKVLIEENISATASKEDVYRTASELPELGFAGIRMAYVDRFTDQKEINEFGHDVAVDNGIKVEIFATQAEADAWLTSNQ
jgi:hypothetical protein